jgi:transcriptional regulator with XRE-family HTH domain
MSELLSFGAWLKRRRKALDLTQEALAQLVGCSVVSIRKFEGDEQRPSRQLAELLAQ